MLRSPFSGHRRYSITHRAVQRLRELVPTLADDDDEELRDRLDEAIIKSEDERKAIKTLDVMLGEPQVLIPLESFGEILYAIIKEDTVVTVLPKGHGEEILQRGQALEQRVAAGEVAVPADREEPDRWDYPRRRWRREVAPPVIERVIRTPGNAPVTVSSDDVLEAHGDDDDLLDDEGLEDEVDVAPETERRRIIIKIPERKATTTSPVEEALARSLDLGRRRAAVAALAEVLEAQDPESEILPLWNEFLAGGLPTSFTVGDLIEAVRRLSQPS